MQAVCIRNVILIDRTTYQCEYRSSTTTTTTYWIPAMAVFFYFCLAFIVLITNFFTALERLQFFLDKHHTIIRGFNLPSRRSCAKNHLFERRNSPKLSFFPLASSFLEFTSRALSLSKGEESTASWWKQQRSTGPLWAPAHGDSCSTWRHCCSDRRSWKRQGW